MHELWIKNRSERDLCSCEGIVAKKTQKKKASDFLLGFLGNCSSCFTTAKITFISILLCHINCAEVSVLSKHLMSKVFASKGELLFFCCLHNHVVSCHSFLLFSIAV